MFELLSVFWAFPGARFFLIPVRYFAQFASVLLFQMSYHNQIMPNTNYTCDIIIATGYINKWYAKKYISLLSKALMTNELWRNPVSYTHLTCFFLGDGSIQYILANRITGHDNLVCRKETLHSFVSCSVSTLKRRPSCS